MVPDGPSGRRNASARTPRRTPGRLSEQLIEDLTGGLGADVVVDAVGVPETLEFCTRIGASRRPRRSALKVVLGEEPHEEVAPYRAA